MVVSLQYMRHVLATITLLVYFTVSTGFIVSLHYCMDQYQSAEIGNSDNDECDLCGMEKEDGCCRDEIKVVKLATTHVLSKIVTPDFSASILPVAHTQYLFSPPILVRYTTVTITRGPPPLNEDIQIHNSIFRI